MIKLFLLISLTRVVYELIHTVYFEFQYAEERERSYQFLDYDKYHGLLQAV
jgi:hypothetical protein